MHHSNATSHTYLLETNLSHILPVHEACQILTRPVVERIVRSLLQWRASSTSDLSALGEAPHDVEALIDSLFYHPNNSKNGTNNTHITPPMIRQAHRQWLQNRQLSFVDKASFLSFLVPALVQPDSSNSTHGHMGLFNCFVFCLQSHLPNASRISIAIPDILIVLAVAHHVHQLQQQGKQLSPQSHSPPIETTVILRSVTMLAFRLYDSYQKKGTLSRDTIHRFFTDVYGEDSHQRPEIRSILNQLFFQTTTTDNNNNNNNNDDHPEETNDNNNHDATPQTINLQATITEATFCQRIMDSLLQQDNTHYHHVCIDWIVTLIRHMMPLPAFPPTVQSYVDHLYVTQRQQNTQALCDLYQLPPTRLYEIKRRFHSILQKQSSTTTQQEEEETITSFEQPPNDDSSSSSASPAPRQAITEQAFVQAVSSSTDDKNNHDTHAYLPERLARRIFQTPKQQSSWGLYQVLLFGCVALRFENKDSSSSSVKDYDNGLLQFLYEMVKMEEGSKALTRNNVQEMLEFLLEYADFRLNTDRPAISLQDDDGDDDMKSSVQIRDGVSWVDAEMASLLNLLPPNLGKEKDVPISKLVDYAMSQTSDPTEMTWEEFLEWNTRDIREDGPISRLEPLMMEMRLVAAVVFGIPPTLASMEIALIEELERRHKARYPQSEVARRGPRGTVWCIIDSNWYKSWIQHVKKASGTSSDGVEYRDGVRGIRGLSRIDNSSLLVDNGSLALKPGIRWRTDYEILPPLAWHALQAWYDGGPPIYRTVVRYVDTQSTSPHSTKSRIPTEYEIELFPYFVTVYLCDTLSKGEARPFLQNHQFSRVTPVGIMLVQLCKELDVDPAMARLWVLGKGSSSGEDFDRSSEDWILDTNQSITDQRKRRHLNGDTKAVVALMIELKDEESGRWPRGIDGTDWLKQKAAALADDEGTLRRLSVPDLGDGIVGLYNMG